MSEQFKASDIVRVKDGPWKGMIGHIGYDTGLVRVTFRVTVNTETAHPEETTKEFLFRPEHLEPYEG